MKTRRLIHADKDTFCEVFWDGTEAEVVSGARGTKGRARRLDFETPMGCNRFVEEEVAKRIKQGFVEVMPEALPIEQAVTAPRATASPQFLAEIAAAYDDDAPRLVYADWLQSQGDPLGELIVVQCERARLERWDPKQRLLKDREDQLLITFRRRWLPELDDDVAAEFRRGFVERVRIVNHRATTKLLDRVLAIAPLVRTLELDGELALERVASAASLRALTGLAIRGALRSTSVERLMEMPELVGITRLALRGCGLGRMALKGLALRAWQELDLHQNTLGANGTRLVLERVEPDALTALDIGSCGVGDDGVKLLAATPLPRLHTLNLRRSSLTRRALGALAAAPGLTALRRIDLSMNGFHEAGPGLGAFCESPKLGALCELDLRNAMLGDAGLEVLARSQLARRLVALDLGTNGITEQGAALLATTPWPALRYLNLSGNPIDKAAEALRSGLPGVRVVLRSTTASAAAIVGDG
ncbi:MAG: TIGR02996 domain-containing protein [Deltaproteobacteria bacterium]|nr:TIGR02996 domain-containing protein [Deltaproteobacteria bacterium]